MPILLTIRLALELYDLRRSIESKSRWRRVVFKELSYLNRQFSYLFFYLETFCVLANSMIGSIEAYVRDVSWINSAFELAYVTIFYRSERMDFV